MSEQSPEQVRTLASHFPPRLRAPLSRARSMVRWMGSGWYYYLRAHRILRQYERHHVAARLEFARSGGQSGEGLRDIADLGVRVQRPGDGSPWLGLPTDYASRVARVAAEVDERFGEVENCVFVPPLAATPATGTATRDVEEVRRGEVIMIQLREPLALPGIEALAEPILEAVERSVFGSHAAVDKVYVYRSPPSERKPLGSWLWHYDNHPREIIKVMVYLTDVDESSGPFEYIRNARTEMALSGERITPLYGGSRLENEYIERLMQGGFESHRVTGPAGTTLVFDHNVIHRANVARARHRDVAVFQIRPSLERRRPCISPEWTGSFQHAPFSPRPELHRPFLERLKHYS